MGIIISRKFKIERIIKLIDKRTWIVLLFFAVIIFFVFRDLFNSYFEADEWFHYTYYLPLTRKPDGFLTAIVSTIISSGPLSAGQHVIPVASAIYFLNTKFFGLNYPPYAFMSLALHSVNSFLVFLVIRTYLKKDILTKNVFAILGGLFFALSPQPSHAITGAAPFYGQNILSVTFFLLCILSFKLAFLRQNKRFIYLSAIFLFLSLFTKETSVFLFALLPFIVLIERRAIKKIFSLKFLIKLFVGTLIIYAIFRFLVPNINQGVGPLVDKLIGSYISSSLPSWQRTVQEPPPLAEKALDISSIHKDVPSEVIFRTISFPIRMTGTLFLPRETLSSIVKLVTPIIYPAPSGDPGARATGQLQFTVGPGNDAVLYLVSILLLILILSLLIRYSREKSTSEFQTLALGFSIIALGALPLVAIVFSFPTWGYDTYFDSRLNYNPNVGAAIVFPFLIFGVARLFHKSFLKKQSLMLIALILFGLWLVNDIFILNTSIRQFTRNFQPDRRKVVKQLKQHLPSLPKITVFYTETDSLSAYGPSLPFQTSVPQALTVVYYDKSPLPDSFFEKPLFEGKGQGYSYSEGRGFGYYSSKKSLSKALVEGKFETSDIYGFFYEAQKIKVNDITSKIRREMQNYLKDAKENSGWKKFSDSKDLSFLYPPLTEFNQTENTIRLENPNFILDIFIIDISPSFDIGEHVKVIQGGNSFEAMPEKVKFDKFHYNDSVVIIGDNQSQYLIKLGDKLIQAKTFTMNANLLQIIERILGSIELIEQK